jgi:hypothetical protein
MVANSKSTSFLRLVAPGARLILDRASDQRVFAGVTDSGATGRLYGNVAGFGEFQQAFDREPTGPRARFA